MGERIEAERSRVKGEAALATVQNAAERRQNTEDLLRQEELLLGTPGQLSGNLGGLSQAELPYAGRFEFDSQQFESIAGRTKWTAGAQAGVQSANKLLEEAQAAARMGDTTRAESLREQANAAVKGGLPGGMSNLWSGSLGNAIQLRTDPNVEAATRLSSPLAQTVGANVARGRELADPNSAERQRLFGQVVSAPVAEISSGQRAALGNIGSRTSSALRDLDQGFGRAIGELTTGERKSLSELDAGFGRALQAITVGEAKSIGEVDNGLNYALEAVRKATENALRSIEAGAGDTRRAATDKMRQRGAAARPFETQQVQARVEERFATQRAISETEGGRQQAALQAGAAGERAGIYERANTNRAELESNEATQKSNVIMGAASGRAQLEGQQAMTKAQIQEQAGMAEAQINLQATLAKADVMQRGTMFVEQFSADFSFASVNQAQAFLQNQAGVREQFQGAMDNLALAGASLLDAQSARAQQASLAMMGTADEGGSGWLQVGAAIAGGAAGFFIGGPTGALAGAQLGGALAGGGGGGGGISFPQRQTAAGPARRTGTPPINPNAPQRPDLGRGPTIGI